METNCFLKNMSLSISLIWNGALQAGIQTFNLWLISMTFFFGWAVWGTAVNMMVNNVCPEVHDISSNLTNIINHTDGILNRCKTDTRNSEQISGLMETNNSIDKEMLKYKQYEQEVFYKNMTNQTCFRNIGNKSYRSRFVCHLSTSDEFLLIVLMISSGSIFFLCYFFYCWTK